MKEGDFLHGAYRDRQSFCKSVRLNKTESVIV